MTGRIYLLNDSSGLIPMEEAPYDSEKLLQEMLSEHPDLLAGEQIDIETPRRWLLVTREMPVQGGQEGSARWSLDHLFLDQDAVPTLIEVKRSSDTRIRREVIGQMLDYAANAVVYWPVEEVRARFEGRCESSGEDPDEVLTAFLTEGDDPDEFWQRVKTNLQAGRIRMVFVADAIPAELRRIVEFLNEQMDPAEVLAIEVRQFVGEGVKTLVPRVLGQTETARQKKGSAAKSANAWDEQSFMEALRERFGDGPQRVAKDLLDWVTPQVTYMWWGKGSKVGGVVPVLQYGDIKVYPCRMTTDGFFVIPLDWLKRKPPFKDESARRELLKRLNEIPGIKFGDEMLAKRVRIPFAQLTNPEATTNLKAAIRWLIEQVNAAFSHDASTARA
jgi:hypothetical protein